MARPPDAIEDTTRLDGAQIDVASRIGWLLRVSRLAAGVSLSSMSERLSAAGISTSVPSVSAHERDGVRDGLVIDAYEHSLGLSPGHLRAPIDILCRTFAYSPSDRSPGLPDGNQLLRFDAALERVTNGEPSGGDWYTFARFFGTGQGWALPSVHMRPLVDRLLNELVRSVGPAFLTRYEAIAQFRCGVYADIVEDGVRDMVGDQGSQSVVINALAAVSERATVRLLDWTGSLLSHRSPWVLRGASMAIQNMRDVGGLSEDEWQTLVPHFLHGYAAANGEPARGMVLTYLFKNLPATTRRSIGSRLPGPLQPVLAPAGWDTSLNNRHYALCENLSRELCELPRLGEQPMLARLLFELMYEFRATRLATSGFLLMCSPFIEDLQPMLLRLGVEGSDVATTQGAVRGLHHAQVPTGTDQVQAWFDAAQPIADPSSLIVAGNAGITLPADFAGLVTDDSETSLRAIEALGMTAHPSLARLAEDPALHPTARAIAAWWIRHGGRVIR